jgi:hypothetical protein
MSEEEEEKDGNKLTFGSDSLIEFFGREKTGF